MRSLWRMLALKWLGGKASEALAGESVVLETLLSLGERPQSPNSFDVRRIPGISHRAMMVHVAERPSDPEMAGDEAPLSGSPGRGP